VWFKKSLTPSQRLVNAVAESDSAAVRAALADGANPNARDRAGCPVVMIAASRGAAAMVDTLLAAGADVHTRRTDRHAGLDDAPLISLPAANGSLETLEAVLSHGATPDASDASGLTPLMCAAFMGHAAIAARLLRDGAAADTRDEKGYTALMFAANAGKAEVVDVLLAAGADPNARDNDRSTPLMFAAQHGFDDCVRRLLARGANPGATGAHGLSAIAFARQNGHRSTEKLLDSP
jgi:uncharacterized protein